MDAAAVDRGEQIGGIGVGAQDDPTRLWLEHAGALEQLGAADLGHALVDDDEIPAAAFERRQSLARRREGGELELAAQAAAQQVDVTLIVVDGEDPGQLAAHRRILRCPWGASRSPVTNLLEE